MNALPADALALWARLFELRLRRLAERVHPSWWGPLAGRAPAPQAPARQHAAAAQWLQIGWPATGAADQPAHALALLESPASARRLLVLRALLRRRKALRLAVAPATRQTLRALVGPAAWQALLHEATDAVCSAPMDTPLPSPDELAWEGFCLLEQEGALPDAACRRLLRLEFPQQAAAPAAALLNGRDAGVRWVLERAHHLIEELPSWWSGCVTPVPTSA